MTEPLDKENLYNSFAVFREIMKGITALTDLNSKWADDDFYYEDDTTGKGRDSRSYPQMHIDTDVNDEHLTLNGARKKFDMVTEVELRTEYASRNFSTADGGGDRNTAYANAIVNYFNVNQRNVIHANYGITKMRINKERSTRIISEKKVSIIKLTFRYRRILTVT